MRTVLASPCAGAVSSGELDARRAGLRAKSIVVHRSSFPPAVSMWGVVVVSGGGLAVRR
ncbi:MAG: hypothetical protein INR71_13150 [Terriglobus roseus]|nr:hypothetical protein [Terriglobus roseus]